MYYNVQAIEQKWRRRWAEQPLGMTKPLNCGEKYYCLDMFPYPSASGLHVGHWRGYVLSDVYTRIKWLEGYNILHPMGWDAFGLPAENDAIKKNIQPALSTAANIANFKKQLKEIGALYDWSREINTTDPEYYKWTQWIFIQMFKAGLAYQAYTPINWCPSCLTGLANEEVVATACERCGAPVTQKLVRQWILKITQYAEQLLEGLDRLDWPEKVKTMQRNWIGKSEGATIFFKVHQNTDNCLVTLPVYTTRADTFYGVTFLALAPDHALADSLITQERQEEIAQYRQAILALTSTERLKNMHEKTGIFTGSYAIHPLTGEQIPIYLANYVLRDYGTGVVMGVPAHDARDFDFAMHYNLPIKQVISAQTIEYGVNGQLVQAYEGDGILINSESFNGSEALTYGKHKITELLIEKGLAERTISYKLRDWVFSRQRYWGEPIPLVHCECCGVVPVPEDQLPVLLPEVEQYQPTGTGESPLAAVDWWVNTTCPVCGSPAKRETNTMPQWAGSCWYFLRYPDPHVADKPFSQEALEYWMPVDLYVGGIEHAILHLLYARFYVKVLYNLGYLNFDEPFAQLFNQGMVGKYSQKTGTVEKMSKSKGNVVNPDDIVRDYGSDGLRMYMLFIGPPELDCEWQDTGLEGIKRFLMRLWTYLNNPDTQLASGSHEDILVTRRLHKFIKDFQERISLFKPNTAISAFMEFINDATAQNMALSLASIEKLCVILSCMAPHMASELLEQLCNKSLDKCVWPTYDPALAAQQETTVAIQVNGKLRGTVQVSVGATESQVLGPARQLVAKWLEDKELVKIIYVQDRLINFIVR